VALTHQLDRRGTPVREFFEVHFPARSVRALSPSWYEVVRAHPVRCPRPAGVNMGAIGTAFDYRARLCWSPIDVKATVAAAGTAHLAALGRDELAGLALDVGKELSLLAPQATEQPLAEAVEHRICRCCYALALYEQFYRSVAAATTSPLLELPDSASMEEVLAVAPDASVRDIAAMSCLLVEEQADLVKRPAVLNPTFDGSRAIGGADADLVAGKLLVELKTTSQDSFERVDYLYQLLGYALLDYSAKYGVTDVGVYLARRGVLVQWSLQDLLETCSLSDDWGQLQASFREAIAATPKAVPFSVPVVRT